MKGMKSRKKEMPQTNPRIPHVLPVFMSFMFFMVRSPLPSLLLPFCGLAGVWG